MIPFNARLEVCQDSRPGLILGTRFYVVAHGILKHILETPPVLLGKRAQGSQQFGVSLAGEFLTFCSHGAKLPEISYLGGGGYVGLLS